MARNCLKLAHQPLFLLIYLYYEVKGKSTKYHKYRFEFASKQVIARTSGLLLPLYGANELGVWLYIP